jgi:uncharacterized protein YidB (DUF937 family)
MGLMDILNGMQNGPRGARQPAPTGSGSGGMSPMMMALLGMLAYKAIKGGGLGNILGGGANSTTPAPGQLPGGTRADTSGGLGGGLGGILGGLGGMLGGATAGQNVPGGLGSILGGLLGGGAAGSVLSGGLRNLIGDMEEKGHGDVAQSWVGRGENQPIGPNELGNALGAEDIDAVSQQTGMPREQILSELSQHLPEFVNQLTTDGRLPTEHEASRWV